MGPNPATFVASLVLVLAACGSAPLAAGWQGPDVHLVDGTWVGAEVECDDGERGLECRPIIARAMGTLAPEVRSTVTRTVLANLPTTYVTADGEQRTASLTGGILTRKAMVMDLVGGARRVVGLWCYLPTSASGSGLDVTAVDCDVAPLEFWLDGNAPPSHGP